MSNATPENEVKSQCLERLKQWQSWGIVVDYDDVSNLGRVMTPNGWVMHTKQGKRDIIAIFKVKDKAWVYLIECKAPDGGNWSEEQQLYAKKFAFLNNVVYEVVSDPQQIDKTLEEITERTKTLLDEGGQHMFPEVVEEEF